MGLFGKIGSFFGGKTTTTTQAVDPASQAYIDFARRQAQQAGGVALGGPAGGGSWFTGPQTQSIGDQAAAFFNPYQQNVIGAVQGQYDQLRAQAANDSRMGGAGAFGGSRQAVGMGARLGQLDQGQAGTIAGLLQGGYQDALGMGTQYAEQQRQLAEQQRMEPLFRQQQALGFYNQGLGPVGYNTTQSSSGGGFSDLLKGITGTAATYFGAGGKLPSWLGGQQATPNANPYGGWMPGQYNPNGSGFYR